MIRPIVPEDTAALLDVVSAIGFDAEELQEIRGMIEGSLDGSLGDKHRWVTVDEGDGPLAVAYFAAERMAVGAWNLLLIAVRPAAQRAGHGTALLRYVEQALTEHGERLLLVETSGTEAFQPARDFYRKNGYEEEARLRDFYEPGDDKIVFRKALSSGDP